MRRLVILAVLFALLIAAVVAEEARGHAGWHHVGHSTTMDVTGINAEIRCPAEPATYPQGTGHTFAYGWVMLAAPGDRSFLQIGCINGPGWNRWRIYAFGVRESGSGAYEEAYAEVPPNADGYVPFTVVNGAPGCMGAFANTTHVLTMCRMTNFYRYGEGQMYFETKGRDSGDVNFSEARFRWAQVKDLSDRWGLWDRQRCWKNPSAPHRGPYGADCYGFTVYGR